MNWVKLAVFAAVAVTASAGQTSVDAFNLNEMGLAAAAQRDGAEAERLYRAAIDIWRKLGPDYTAHLAITENNLAQVFSARGDRKGAIRMFEDAIALYRRSLGPKDPHALAAMNLLAGVQLMVGNNAAARDLLNEAMEIEKQYFPDSLDMAHTMTGMAGLKLQTGQEAEGLPYAEEGLLLSLKHAGERSIDTALAYAMVGEIHRVCNRPERALPLYRKARAIYEALLGPDHVRVASLLSQEGLVLMGDHKLSLAEQAMNRSIEILDRSCPACVQERIVSESNLGLLKLREGKYTDADRLLSHAVALQEENMAAPSADLAYMLTALSAVRKKEHRFEDAARLSQRASLIKSYQ